MELTTSSVREEVLKYALEQYQTQPEYPWLSAPNYAVLRHEENRKWFGVVIDVPRAKLGLAQEGMVDILNVKCDPVFSGSMRLETGILPGYHMHKGHWLSVLLDGTVARELVFALLDHSWQLTSKKPRKGKT